MVKGGLLSQQNKTSERGENRLSGSLTHNGPEKLKVRHRKGFRALEKKLMVQQNYKFSPVTTFSQKKQQPDGVSHACDPSTRELVAGGLP